MNQNKAETAWQVELWPTTRFRPYERNPRKNDHVVAQMESSIRSSGIVLRLNNSGEKYHPARSFE
jgi:hypothetical protein